MSKSFMSSKCHHVWHQQHFLSVGFGWVHLSEHSSFSFCLLFVWVFIGRRITFFQHQFYSVSNISFKHINYGILNLCFLMSSCDVSLMGTCQMALSAMLTWSCEISFFSLSSGFFSSCVDLNPYSLKILQTIALFVPAVAEYSDSLAAETTPHYSSGHLANHCQNCFVAQHPAKSLSHSADDLLVCSPGGPKASKESLFCSSIISFQKQPGKLILCTCNLLPPLDFSHQQ